jgi:hypothetical protein
MADHVATSVTASHAASAMVSPEPIRVRNVQAGTAIAPPDRVKAVPHQMQVLVMLETRIANLVQAIVKVMAEDAVAKDIVEDFLVKNVHHVPAAPVETSGKLI